MPNDVKLQSPEGKHPLDENLRPLKIGDKSSSLELAQHGNGCRINGDLLVTGDISGSLGNRADIVSTDLTIDDSGDITLDADGGNVFIKDGGTQFLKFSKVNSTIFLFENGGASSNDYLQISCQANGESVISTTDAAGTDAGLYLNADGYISLNSATGVFIARNAGDEFSAANSAYAGMILGYTAIGIDATTDTYSVTASFVITDADHKVTFVAPPSGKVEIEINISVISVSARWLVLCLADTALASPIDFPNSNDVTNEHTVGDIQVENIARALNHKWVVAQLVAGTEYTWYLGAIAEQAGRITLHWGGDAADEYAPFIMKATALPATIYTG